MTNGHKKSFHINHKNAIVPDHKKMFLIIKNANGNSTLCTDIKTFTMIKKNVYMMIKMHWFAFSELSLSNIDRYYLTTHA